MTGIPETEAQSLRSRGEDYKRYQDEVSVFVPLPSPAKAGFLVIADPVDRAGHPPRSAAARGDRAELPPAPAPRAAARDRRARAAWSRRDVDRRRSRSRRGAANDQHYELPPRVLRARARPAAQVLGLLLARRRRDARRRRGDDARAHLRAGRHRGRHGRARPRLRLGLAVAAGSPRAIPPAGSSPSRTRPRSSAFIDGLGHPNLEVVTADINAFAPEGRFDRVVSVEMFEHMRNWRCCSRAVAGCCATGRRAVRARLPHRRYAYAFDAGDWMAPALLHRRDHALRRSVLRFTTISSFASTGA